MLSHIKTVFCAVVFNLLLLFVSASNLDDSIIIIGAGSSGYAAACRLLENGFKNVQIFEAESRIGGRTYTKHVNGYALDIGAQWIHGQGGNVVYEMASKLNLTKPSIVDDDQYIFVRTNGDIINKKLGQAQFNFFYTLTEENENFGKSSERMGDLISKKYKQFVDNTKPFEDSDKEEAISQFLRYFEGYVGTYLAVSDWNLENGIGYWSYKKAKGNQAISWRNGGWANVFNILKKTHLNEPLPIDDRIFLNRRVNSIKWDDEKVTVGVVDGPTFEADKVIVTVSLGVLKETSDHLFDPPLPTKTKKAIESLGFGTVNKIHLIFEKQWWTNEIIHILWTSEDIENLKPEEKWMSTIMSMSPVDNAPTAITLWYYGNHDLTLVENQSDDDVKASVLKLLRRIFHGKQIPDPIQMERSNWSALKSFRGSYSYQSILAYENNITNADLKQPLKNEDGEIKVLFAGEATSSVHFSTVHGAIESGWAAADLIIKEAE